MSLQTIRHVRQIRFKKNDWEQWWLGTIPIMANWEWSNGPRKHQNSLEPNESKPQQQTEPLNTHFKFFENPPMSFFTLVCYKKTHIVHNSSCLIRKQWDQDIVVSCALATLQWILKKKHMTSTSDVAMLSLLRDLDIFFTIGQCQDLQDDNEGCFHACQQKCCGVTKSC